MLKYLASRGYSEAQSALRRGLGLDDGQVGESLLCHSLRGCRANTLSRNKNNTLPTAYVSSPPIFPSLFCVCCFVSEATWGVTGFCDVPWTVDSHYDLMSMFVFYINGLQKEVSDTLYKLEILLEKS